MLFCLSPLLAGQLASIQSTQGHLIINLSKTLGKFNCWMCMCMCTHMETFLNFFFFCTFLIIWLFCFAVYLSGPLLLSICRDTYKVIMTNSEFLRAFWSLSPSPWKCVEMFVSYGELMYTRRSDWPWPLNGLCISDREKVQYLCSMMVLCPAVSRDCFIRLAGGPELQELSWLFSQQF